MSSLVNVEQYPLTNRWLPKIYGFSFREKVPFRECLQESLILEWEMRSKALFDSYKERTNQIVDKDKKKNRMRSESVYFQYSLLHRLETMMLKDFRNQEVYVTHTDKRIADVSKWRRRTLSLSDLAYGNDNLDYKNSSDTLDRFVSCRSFNEMYYTELVAHVANILMARKSVLAEMFLYRMHLEKDWKEIKKQYFKSVPHNKFYGRVKLIKRVVQKEVCDEWSGSRERSSVMV